MCNRSCLQDRAPALHKQRRRRVTFGNMNEPPCVSIETFERVAKDDRPNVFMSSSEISENSRRHRRGVKPTITGDTYSGTLLLAYGANLGSSMARSESARLAKHTYLQPECRGVERSFAGDFNFEVKRNRRRARRGVLSMHDTLSSCETIAETYRQRSEASVNFSIMMGRIDDGPHR